MHSANFAKWATVAQTYWFHKTGDANMIHHAMGELPRVETKQAIIPNKGDLRDLVLLGGHVVPAAVCRYPKQSLSNPKVDEERKAARAAYDARAKRNRGVR